MTYTDAANSGELSPPDPSLYVSESYMEMAREQEVVSLLLHPAHVVAVACIARGHAIPRLEAIVLRTPDELLKRTKKPLAQTSYLTLLDNGLLPSAETEDSVTNFQLTRPQLTVGGVALTIHNSQPTQPQLAADMYHAVDRWRHPAEGPRTNHDRWFGVAAGTGLGLAEAVVESSIADAPSPLEASLRISAGVAVGALALTPMFRSLRWHFNRSSVQGFAPVQVTSAATNSKEA